MSSTQAAIAAVRKTVTVGCTVERAFEVFTEEIGSWWPLETHSLPVGKDGAGAPVTAVLEPWAGGRLYERTADGGEVDWGTVRAWEPPRRLVVSWDVHRAGVQTEFEVRFEPAGDGTRVELEHRGWERLGERGAELRTGYDGGWDTVLGRYVEAANA